MIFTIGESLNSATLLPSLNFGEFKVQSHIFGINSHNLQFHHRFAVLWIEVNLSVIFKSLYDF